MAFFTQAPRVEMINSLTLSSFPTCALHASEVSRNIDVLFCPSVSVGAIFMGTVSRNCVSIMMRTCRFGTLRIGAVSRNALLYWEFSRCRRSSYGHWEQK